MMYKSGRIDATTAMQMMADLAAKSASAPTPESFGNGKDDKKRPRSAVDEDEVSDSDMESIENHVGSHLVS